MAKRPRTALKAKATLERDHGRNQTRAGSPRIAPPDLDSPLVLSAFDQKVNDAARKIIDNPFGSRGYKTFGGGYRTLEIRHIKSGIDRKHFQLAWPSSLYIPSRDDYKKHWPHIPPPDTNRYARDWTYKPSGLANASAGDGSLFAWMSSPTVKGAIDGKAEAGVGVLFTAKRTLSRLRVEPVGSFIGRHEWNVAPPPVVRVTTHVTGTLLVGGFVQNPVTGGFEGIMNSPWRRLNVFNEYHLGHGATMMTTVPFELDQQPAGEVLVEAGRTYLISVVAQVALRVQTTKSDGTPIDVTQGTFNTWGSLAGVVSQLWLKETVLIN